MINLKVNGAKDRLPLVLAVAVLITALPGENRAVGQISLEEQLEAWSVGPEKYEKAKKLVKSIGDRRGYTRWEDWSDQDIELLREALDKSIGDRRGYTRWKDWSSQDTELLGEAQDDTTEQSRVELERVELNGAEWDKIKREWSVTEWDIAEWDSIEQDRIEWDSMEQDRTELYREWYEQWFLGRYRQLLGGSSGSDSRQPKLQKEDARFHRGRRRQPREKSSHRDSGQLKLQEGDSRITSISIGNARAIFSDLAAGARANGGKRLWTAVSYARLGHGESASKTNVGSLRVGYSPLAANSSRSLAVIVSIDRSRTSLEEKNGDALEGELTSTGAGIALRGASGIADGNFGLGTLLYYGYGYNKASLGGAISKDLGSFNSHSLGLALGLDYRIELGRAYSLVPTLAVDYLRSSLAEREGGLSSLSLSSVTINYGLEGTMALTKLLELTLGLDYSQVIALGSHRDLYRDRDSLNFSLELAGRLAGGNRVALALAYRTAEGAAGPVAVFQKGFSSLGRFGIRLDWSL
ncbi:MAG: autotransporter outer membrane beta-barrel domain-containing protein [Rickettsiales bacterium]|nr:autotransporter outer membrane beta-barrel domain-containing protein [Rickettsiales bacterium]